MSKFLTLSKIYINNFFNWFLKQLSQKEIKKIKEKPVNAIFNKALILVFFSFISLVFIFISCGRNSTYLTIEELKNSDGTYNIELVKQQSKNGNPLAQSTLGYIYYFGEGVNINYFEAVKWFKKAAEQGDVEAQLFLALAYIKGQGVNKDYFEGVKWFKKAAEQGNANAQLMLGECYKDGLGVNKDYYEAVKWLKKAADQGNVKAQVALGSFYIVGQGVNQDYSEAVKWFKKAAKQGDTEAQNALVVLHKYGFIENQEKVLAQNNNNFDLFKNAEFECKKTFEKNITATFKTYFSGSEKSYKLEFSNGKEIWINYLNTERDGRAYFNASNGIKAIFGTISFTKDDLEINFEDSDYENINGVYSRTR